MPQDMASRYDLDDVFWDMRDCFQDKETEQNWIPRDKAVMRLRKITMGNSPTEFRDAYLAGIKSLLEGIIKTINSLRTTLSAHGCELIQEIAKTKTPGIDGILEIVLPHLVKLCGSTKKIGASKAETTVNIIIENVSYNIYLMKQIWSACDDKNVQPRKSATVWLKTLIGKHRNNKNVFEKGEGLSLFEKCLKKGLADSNPEVRKSMRSPYWAFIRLWPDRAEGILSTLTEQHRKVLINETAEIGFIPAKAAAAAGVPATAAVTAATAKPAASKPKPSIKDAIAARRQAAKADAAAPEPKISTSSSSATRPAALTASTRTLSSAPVRPSRFTRKVTAASKAASPEPTKSTIEVPKPAAPSRPVTPVDRDRERRLMSRRLSDKYVEHILFDALGCNSPGTKTPPRYSPLSSPEKPTEVSKPSRPVTPEEAKRPLTPVTIAAMAKAAWSPKRETEVPTSSRAVTPDEAKRPLTPGTIAAMAKAGWSPKQEPKTPTSSRAVTPDEAKRPLTPGTIAAMAKAGWSPKREHEVSAPESVASPVTVIRSFSKASDAPTVHSVDRPERPIFSRKEGLARKALEELPVNEPIKPKRKPMSTDPAEMTPEEKWSYVERIHRRASPTARLQSTDSLRVKMRAHIQKLKGAPREDTFHGIVSIVKGSWLVLDDEPELFDELLLWVIEQMESKHWDTIKIDEHGGDHDTQTILVLRILMANHASLMSAYYPRLLCALLSASRNQDYRTHMRPLLEETIFDIVKECNELDLEDSIDAVLDKLETTEIEPDPQVPMLGLYTLTHLMKRSSCTRLVRPEDQGIRLAKVGGRFCRANYADMRHSACDLLMQYRIFIDNDEVFWRRIESVGPKCVRLLSYFYEKEMAEQRLETERLLMKRAMDDDVD
ncbi:MAG: hypothetical protein Q9219_003425 [cf. Caloplaca sp. 3 TL-2023]